MKSVPASSVNGSGSCSVLCVGEGCGLPRLVHCFQVGYVSQQKLKRQVKKDYTAPSDPQWSSQWALVSQQYVIDSSFLHNVEVTGGLAVKALDYSVRGCEFKFHRLLPRGRISLEYSVSRKYFNILYRLPPAKNRDITRLQRSVVDNQCKSLSMYRHPRFVLVAF